ncbi:MAG TPA: adenylate/guanylate cyclase domain-containing protein, partial [Candidatus Limnocylindrales bacterium]|nr:adenylate/guanylate cyclase domain-containing protein [Candidatus Limnocylindrales bacterium]
MRRCPECDTENPTESKFCSECGARLTPTPGGGEVRKVVTIVFADVVGSTAMGERIDPESLRTLMGRYFAVARRTLERHGGNVEKFIGDAVVAIFGVPVIHEDDALRAVRAAHELRDGVAALAGEIEREGGPRLEVRVGVNTGEIVAGGRGAGETIVTGDAVNVAARLEQSAGPGEVLLGAETLRLVRDAVVVEAVPPLTVKGKEAPLDAYRLVELRPEAPARGPRLEAPMVGRERELARLSQAFEDVVAERRCHLFTLLGAAGVGKSRLVREFERS